MNDLTQLLVTLMVFLIMASLCWMLVVVMIGLTRWVL